MLLYVECALSSLVRLVSEVLLFLFFLFYHTINIFVDFFSLFFFFCLRDVEELIHGIRGLLHFPVSCLVHFSTVPDFVFIGSAV